MQKTLSFQRVTWFWTLTGPYFPGSKSHDGEEETFEAARDGFKKEFWEIARLGATTAGQGHLVWNG
jgi:hypothetical protein